MAYHRTTDVKVLSGESSNPTSFLLGSFNKWREFETEIGHFFFIGEPISFIILELQMH